MAQKIRCFKIFDFIQCFEGEELLLTCVRGETHVSVWPQQQTNMLKTLQLHLPEQI